MNGPDKPEQPEALEAPKPQVEKCAASVLGYLTCTAHSVYWSSRAGERCPMCETERLGTKVGQLETELAHYQEPSER